VELAPGQEATVEFVLDKRAFAYYNADIKDWHVESGDFEILIGSSSKDIALRETIKVNSTVRIKRQFTRNSLLGDIMADPAAFQVMKELATQLNIPLGVEDMASDETMAAILKYTPLRALVAFSGGAFTEDMMNMLINKLNEIG